MPTTRFNKLGENYLPWFLLAFQRFLEALCWQLNVLLYYQLNTLYTQQDQSFLSRLEKSNTDGRRKQRNTTTQMHNHTSKQTLIKIKPQNTYIRRNQTIKHE